MNIIFYESTIYSGGSRLMFQKRLISKEITLVTVKERLKNIHTPIDILFYHASNKEIFIDLETNKKNWDSKLENTIKVAWGGRATVKQPLNVKDKEIGYLKYTELDQKILDFKSFVYHQKSIEEIYNFLFDINDEIEDLGSSLIQLLYVYLDYEHR